MYEIYIHLKLKVVVYYESSLKDICKWHFIYCIDGIKEKSLSDFYLRSIFHCLLNSVLSTFVIGVDDHYQKANIIYLHGFDIFIIHSIHLQTNNLSLHVNKFIMACLTTIYFTWSANDKKNSDNL